MNRVQFRKNNPLSKEQYNELKRRYYDTCDTTADLIKEFNLVGIKPSQLYLLFDDVTTKEKCPYCGSFMKHLPLSRQSKVVDRNLECTNCNHKYHKYPYELCECDNCVNKRKYEIWKFFQTEHSIDFGTLSELTAFERIYLGTLHLYGRDEKEGYILPYSQQKEKLTFWDEDEEENLFNSLYEKRCFVISPKSDVESFGFDRDNKIDLDNGFVAPPYELWLDENDISKLNQGNVLLGLDKIECWMEINREEAKYYLMRIFEGNYIRNYSIKKVNKIINAYSIEFSLAEILSVIKYVTSSHLYDLHLKKISKQEVVEKIFYHLESYYKRAKLNREQFNKYGRKSIFEDVSYMTKYFYECVLGDKKWFYEPPKDFWVKHK